MVIDIILLVLNLSNVIIHSIGAYILISLYKKSRQKTQRLYLIHLSITECIVNLFELIRIIPTLLPIHLGDGVNTFREYALIVSFTCVSFVYYCVMMWITLDRLILIAFGVNYSAHWNERKSRFLMIATWLAGICLCLVMSVSKALSLFDWKTVFFTYFVPTLDFTFLLLALVTYSFIFMKYNRSQRQLASEHSKQKQLLKKTTKLKGAQKATKNKSSFSILKNIIMRNKEDVEKAPKSLVDDKPHIYCPQQQRRLSNASSSSVNSDIVQPTLSNRCVGFRKSVYFVPTLLIATFLIFMVTPDLVYLFVGIIGGSRSNKLLAACWISYAVSSLTDAWIYLFMQRDVKEALKKKMKWFCCCFGDDSNNDSVRLNIILSPKRDRSCTIESTLSDDKS